MNSKDARPSHPTRQNLKNQAISLARQIYHNLHPRIAVNRIEQTTEMHQRETVCKTLVKALGMNRPVEKDSKQFSVHFSVNASHPMLRIRLISKN